MSVVYYCCFVAKHISRKRSPPTKYNIYWDASIPMQYYEEDFLEFEEYANLTGLKQMNEQENGPEFLLAKFEKYERWMKNECRKEWKRFLKSQRCKANPLKSDNAYVPKKVAVKSVQVNTVYSVNFFICRKVTKRGHKYCFNTLFYLQQNVFCIICRTMSAYMLRKTCLRRMSSMQFDLA